MAKFNEMRNLIAGQTIRIDNHSRGDTKPASWDLTKIHIHKIMNKDRYNGADFSVYFDSSKPIQFNKVKGKSSLIEKQLKKEINTAFKDKSKREAFAKFIVNELNKYSNDLPIKARLIGLETAAKEIGLQFGFRNSSRIEIVEICRDEILKSVKKHTTKIVDINGKSIFILQDINEKTITIGENLDLINNWDETIKLFNQEK